MDCCSVQLVSGKANAGNIDCTGALSCEKTGSFSMNPGTITRKCEAFRSAADLATLAVQCVSP